MLETCGDFISGTRTLSRKNPRGWKQLGSTTIAQAASLQGLRYQNNFANVLSCLNVSMSLPYLIKWKSFVDVRTNPTIIYSVHYRLQPFGDLLSFAPHVAQIQAEDTLVSIQ